MSETTGELAQAVRDAAHASAAERVRAALRRDQLTATQDAIVTDAVRAALEVVTRAYRRQLGTQAAHPLDDVLQGLLEQVQELTGQTSRLADATERQAGPTS